ncbi:zinc ABC transporter substrate-binding protein [Clostridium botulinum]|uniref:ABC transporter substrate-binding protein n=1 Tax=Clostridium botulinum C/D str. DC5 TaxID=1443128 RepID=A0A0A0I7Y2_CLOBO|nr:zinc ABC transporter substrate-binding protein [Clostridium botulinum]KEI05572.1 ABC transporter substrate-binding protein [Clostridium botulinum C/D str. BKT75002]KEI09673.1 ABC transporter substrate-binding protein [Clostridium botulinum C/D str. BKT2873]KGM95073.1 ABC transporter substrate-binding protein [Clostridium botulinum D str. CCUG 7971]KGM96406.1 ABC transporter substrate-binding protein [Clostridium botulinum C/D str. DC5]KOC49244.1 ABC transporter substrate-binding protein [Cl
MKNVLKKLFITTTFIAILILTGCTKNSVSNKNNTTNDKLTVAVSIVPEETFVKSIAGDLVNVVTMIPPGQSPETFEPTPDLLEKFSKSKLYFTMNVPAEVNSILPKTKDFNPDVKIVDLSNEVRKTYKDREFAPGSRDPHIWLSPKRVKIMINVIKDNLCSLDPNNKNIYEKNAESYIRKLDEADKNIKDSLKTLKTKSIIVYHPAFGYFTDDYGLEMIALEEEGKESTPQDMQKIIDFAKSKGIKTIFYQAETDNKQSTTFAKELGGKAEKLAPLDPNYIENLKKMSDTFKSILN